MTYDDLSDGTGRVVVVIVWSDCEMVDQRFPRDSECQLGRKIFKKLDHGDMCFGHLQGKSMWRR